MKKVVWIQIVIALALVGAVVGMFLAIKNSSATTAVHAQEVEATIGTSVRAETVATLLDSLIVERAQIGAQLVKRGKEVRVIELAEMLARDSGTTLEVRDVSFVDESTDEERKKFIKAEQEDKIIEFAYLEMDTVVRGQWSEVFMFIAEIESAMKGIHITHIELESVERGEEAGGGFEWVAGLTITVRAQ